MSRKYKFHNKEGLYFVSFATVNWIDVFVRPAYNDLVVECLNYCVANLGMRIYCWCIMPSHIHLIFSATDNNPEIVLGRFKEHTSKQLIKAIAGNLQESRREWLLCMFKRAAAKSNNVTNYQFWQHNNPVEAGFVNEASHWKYSSAIDYADGKGLVNIEYL